MAITLDTLRDEVNASTSDAAALQRALDVTQALLDKYIADHADAVPHGIPVAVYDQALLAMAVDEFNRRQAPNGILTQQFDLGDGGVAAPVRVSSDPLRAARPLLSPWCIDIAIGGAV